MAWTVSSGNKSKERVVLGVLVGISLDVDDLSSSGLDRTTRKLKRMIMAVRKRQAKQAIMIMMLELVSFFSADDADAGGAEGKGWLL